MAVDAKARPVVVRRAVQWRVRPLEWHAPPKQGCMSSGEARRVSGEGASTRKEDGGRRGVDSEWIVSG